MKQKVKYGVGFLGDVPPNQIISDMKYAEDLGFCTGWIAEDYYCGGAFSISGACAVNTKKIDIAIGVINPFTRHPALTAMEAAALYDIAGGRIKLGLGGSNRIWIENQMGIPFQKVLSAMDDSVAIMKSMFRGDKVNYQGEKFCVNGIVPRIPKCPDLPVIMGVKSEKMLRLAGKIANGALLSVGTSVPYVKWVKEQLYAGAAEAGGDLSGFEISAYILISIDQDEARAREKVRSKIAYYLGLHGDDATTKNLGLSKEQLDDFRAGFLAGQARADLVTEELIDTLAVAGSPDRCRRQIEELTDAGVTEIVMFQMPEIPVRNNMDQVKTYLMEG